MTDPTPNWVIIVEWEDGTVGTNGPYTSLEMANIACGKLTGQIQDGPAEARFENGLARWVVEDQLDVYVQPMGLPYTAEQLKG
jgi:hypothetical protein